MRTNALDQTKRDLNRDLNALLRVWRRVGKEAGQGNKPKLIYSDQDLILRTLRDTLDSSVEEILVDDTDALEQAREYLKAFMPRTKIRLQHYDDRTPLFSRYGLEAQIERIYDRRVSLPGGGSIVIDPTEALVAIDVNSGRTRGGSGEETALNTNLEAAKEVARQLRLRDIGGLVVVDFIDMRATKNRRRLEKELKDALKDDRARAYVGRVSPNGLLEVNRQRIQQELRLRSQQPCPTCHGTGRIASIDVLGLNIMRRLRAGAAGAAGGEGGSHVKVLLHPDTATEFQNSRRADLMELEREFDLVVEVVPSHDLHRPDCEVEWTGSPRPAKAARAPSPLVDASQLTLADSAKPSTQRRSRGGRGRRGGRGAKTAEPDSASKASAAPPEAAASPEPEASAPPPEKKRRRRRGGRGRKKAAASAPQDPAEKGAPKDRAAAPLPPDPMWTSAWQEEFDSPDGEDPVPATAKSADAPGPNGSPGKARPPAPAAEAQAPTPAGEDPGATAEKKPRRRRRRRRKRAAGSESSPSADGAAPDPADV